jgi:GNAT superfamily N-acetyltransferase
VHVLAARLDALAIAADPHRAVRTASAPDEAWLGRYRDGAGAAPAARALLTRHPRACFASAARDGAVVAIGRGVIDDGWLGVSAVEVAQPARRQGLATAVMAALCGWGLAQGATRSYLQVSSDNPAALALYGRLGYWQHHDYHYRAEP